MRYELALRIDDQEVDGSAEWLNRVRVTWKAEADQYRVAFPFDAAQRRDAKELIDDHFRFQFRSRILGPEPRARVWRAKFRPSQIAQMRILRDAYNNPDQVDLDNARAIIETERMLSWADSVDRQAAMSDVQLEEIRARREMHGYKNGDVVQVFSSDDARRVWDEMRVERYRGKNRTPRPPRVTEEQYDAAKLPDGTHRFPFGSDDLKGHFCCACEDMTETQAQRWQESELLRLEAWTAGRGRVLASGMDEDALMLDPAVAAYLQSDEDGPPQVDIHPVTGFCRCWGALAETLTYQSGAGPRKGYDAGTLARIRDRAQSVAVRHDKPFLASEITLMRGTGVGIKG